MLKSSFDFQHLAEYGARPTIGHNTASLIRSLTPLVAYSISFTPSAYR